MIMETVLFNKKQLEVLEKNGLDYLVLIKGKKYYLKSINLDNFNDEIFNLKRLKIAGVKSPKMKKIDKKNGLVLFEHIEGQTLLDILASRDLGADELTPLFKMDFYARNEHIQIKFVPENFVYNGKDLYYVGYDVKDGYDGKFFENDKVNLFFYSKQLYDHLVARGYKGDLNRVKQTYDLNKAIVQAVCQYSY